ALLLAALEHLEHALGDDVAADGITRGQEHADETDRHLEAGLGTTQRHHGADQHDAVHEVRARHEGRVEDDRHPTDDLVPDERRQHENVKRDEAVNHRCASWSSVVPCHEHYWFFASRDWRVLSCFISPSRVSTVFANTSSSQSIFSSPSLIAGLRKLNRFLAYISLACLPSFAGRLTGPTIFTLFSMTVSPARVSSQLPPVSAARSTITAPGIIVRTAAAEIILGAGRPGIAAVLITTSDTAISFSSAACCFCFSSSVSSRA